jgi:hypothetical protein
MHDCVKRQRLIEHLTAEIARLDKDTAESARRLDGRLAWGRKSVLRAQTRARTAMIESRNEMIARLVSERAQQTKEIKVARPLVQGRVQAAIAHMAQLAQAARRELAECRERAAVLEAKSDRLRLAHDRLVVQRDLIQVGDEGAILEAMDRLDEMDRRERRTATKPC